TFPLISLYCHPTHRSTLFPYTTLFRSRDLMDKNTSQYYKVIEKYKDDVEFRGVLSIGDFLQLTVKLQPGIELRYKGLGELSEDRSEEHTSELQSRFDLVCRLLLENKNK